MIPADQIKYEAYPDGGRNRVGGQMVGTHGGVRAIHEPSGIEAIVNIGRSQHINKMIADDMILAALTHPKFR